MQVFDQQHSAVVTRHSHACSGFRIRAARQPRAHLSLIWFTVWSSVVHAGIMAVQSFGHGDHMGHLWGDVPALLLVAAVLGVLTRSLDAGQPATT